MKVLLDANILFSTANLRWLTRHLLDVLEQIGAELTSSAYVWDEAERKVRSHFPMNLDELGKLKHKPGWIEDAVLTEGLFEFLPEKDCPVLAAAIHGNCTHLLTGDYKRRNSALSSRQGEPTPAS